MRLLSSIRQLKQAEIQHILKLPSSHENHDRKKSYQLFSWFEFTHAYSNIFIPAILTKF